MSSRKTVKPNQFDPWKLLDYFTRFQIPKRCVFFKVIDEEVFQEYVFVSLHFYDKLGKTAYRLQPYLGLGSLLM